MILNIPQSVFYRQTSIDPEKRGLHAELWLGPGLLSGSAGPARGQDLRWLRPIENRIFIFNNLLLNADHTENWFWNCEHIGQVFYIILTWVKVTTDLMISSSKRQTRMLKHGWMDSLTEQSLFQFVSEPKGKEAMQEKVRTSVWKQRELDFCFFPVISTGRSSLACHSIFHLRIARCLFNSYKKMASKSTALLRQRSFIALHLNHSTHWQLAS